MTAVEWDRGFSRLTLFASGVLLVGALLLHMEASWVIAVAVIPWAIFITVRWLARGFAPKPDPVEAVKLVDDLAKRLSDGEVSPQMVEEILASLPPEQLLLVQRVHADKLKALDDKMLAIVTKGAREGKTISREKALKGVIENRDNYAGPDREQVVAQLDALINDFRARFPEEIPADDAYRLMRELEGRVRQSS